MALASVGGAGVTARAAAISSSCAADPKPKIALGRPGTRKGNFGADLNVGAK